MSRAPGEITMKRIAMFCVATVVGVAASVACADFHLFMIHEAYSNADGSVQFVVLRSDVNGEHRWKFHTLTSSGPGGPPKVFVFPADLPSSRTEGKAVLVATEGFAALGLVTPDYVIPNGFLRVPSGTIDFAGVSVVTYGQLPTDGVHAYDFFTSAAIPNVATNFAGASASVVPTTPPPPAVVALAVEYYNAGLDHYFLTHVAGEIALLDAGTTIKGWVRTGQSFNVYTGAATGSSPVCRYYIPPAKGDSHFYGRGTAECTATGAANPSFVNEDPQFFHVVLPVAGACPAGTRNVYRVFSNRADANHRYSVDRAIRDLMVTRAWLAEGDGPDLVVMCSPL